MKISNDGSNGKYIYVDNKLSDEKTLYDKTENNEKSVNVNDEQLMVTNLEKNIANTNNFYYLINKSIYKEREVRDVFPAEVNEQNFQTEALINLIKRAKDNITNLISIKNTNEYLNLKEEIYHLQLKITNEKLLFSVLKSQDELSPIIKEDIRIHERTIKLYRDILFLAEKSTIINHIYQLGFNLNLNPISKIIDKMEEIENAISKFDELNRSTDKEDFNQQKEKIIKDLDDFTKSINMGRERLNDHFIKIIQDEINSKLSAISHTPIGFSLHNIFQQKIDYQLQHTDSNDEKTVLQSIYKIDQLTNLFNIKYRFDFSGLTQDIIKTYALQKIYAIYNTDKHAFGELSIEDIINTEIIYSYTAPNNNTQYSTFTIFDYLTRHINDMNSLLIKRENVNIRFPVEYRAELINYLDEEAKNLKKQIDLINNINSLKEERDKLQEKMPNLEKYLEIYLAKISKEHNVDPTSLDDLVEFRYEAYSFNPELNAAINNIHPPVEKLYTVRDIFLGRERKWLSENTDYKLDEVLGALYPTQYTKKIISEINSADIQNSYIVEMEEIKKNQEIKKQFYEFLEQALTTYDKKDVLYYLLENNPLLLVFPDEDRGPKTGIDKTINSIDPGHTPIALISLLTGECLRYPSFRDFKHSIIEDNVLNLWIKQHLSNYSEINPSQLKLFRENDDFSFLFEDIINFNIKKADILIRSHNEALMFELFERFKDITFPYTFFTFLMGNIPGIVYGSVLSATPSFLQASISDTEDEYKRYLNEGVMNIMAEILGTVIPEAFSYSAMAAVKAINLFVKYKFNRKILQLDKDIVTKLANDFHHKHNKLNIGLTPIENGNRFLLEIKPAFNPNNLTINIPAAQYLTELQLTSSVAAKINNPAAEFDTSMIAITKFMSEHGMTDIRYRGIYIWHNVMDDTPINHIAVIGKKEGKNYVFDLTAHRFKKISRSSLDGPLILEESEWKKRYLLAFADSVVKYKDFVGEQMAASEFKKYSYISATEVIDGTQILTKPDWYLNELSGQRVFKNKINYSINNNPIRDIVHKMYWYNKLPKDNNNYISEVLYNAKLLINKEYKQNLAEGLSRIQQNRAIENSQSLWLQVLHSYREINNMDELLLVKPGEIVFLNTEEGKLISMMISLGNGLFSSLENNKLCPYLINNNGIIMAEQIGQFVEGQLEQFGMSSDKLKVYAGQAIGSQVPKNSINEVVEQSLKDEVLELPEYMTKILKQANELTDEQATIFYQDLKALCTTGNNRKSIKNLLTDIKLIDNKNTKLIDMNSVISLAELPPGRLVAFYGTDYELKSMMVSLGEGQFVISHGARIGINTEHYNGIVSASQFEDIVNGRFRNSNVISGSVNLQAIRQDSLLGKDSIFNLEGNTLWIKAQGVPTIVNYMDGEDFSNIIEGLAIKSLGFNNWQKVETIELQSCFSAVGSIPVAQVLANKLNKKVIAYPLSLEKGLVKNNLPSVPKAKIYEAGVYFSDDDLKLASEQSYKNNLFWQQLLLLFENTKKLIDSEKSLKNGVDDKILSLIVESAKLISKKITVDDFLLLHPEYYGFNPELVKDLIPRMDMLLKTTEITNANEFAELMIKVISLTSNSYVLLDKFMGQSLEAIKSLNEYLIEDNFKK